MESPAPCIFLRNGTSTSFTTGPIGYFDSALDGCYDRWTFKRHRLLYNRLTYFTSITVPDSHCTYSKEVVKISLFSAV